MGMSRNEFLLFVKRFSLSFCLLFFLMDVGMVGNLNIETSFPRMNTHSAFLDSLQQL
ncbi:Cysteine and histidine-rich domain-containing protein RAR1 isoform 2 [Theobroma cacao]|uniref:Cysteine and histidine-rich domain-containing protein RAR1 isoform 2 n=1 Tax=Theobroma cacao TaxID=3641 RepID=A0A061G1A3_THECC|nr:Cysteine and histidine-rich domain-containing protein RAR1 isoform 2 [Theobroma cacao]